MLNNILNNEFKYRLIKKIQTSILIALILAAIAAPLNLVYGSEENIRVDSSANEDINKNQDVVNTEENSRHSTVAPIGVTPTDESTELPDSQPQLSEPLNDIAKDKAKEEIKPKEEEPAPEAMRVVNTSASVAKYDPQAQPKANVDLSSGALVYEYPIKLPEGRSGMTPDLSLKYDSRFSSKPDSYTGLGWEVNIPYIQREPVKGTQNLYSSAYFSSSISGNLIATTDASTSQFTVYLPESDSGDYLKYTFNNNNSWSMSGKDGRTYIFGGSVGSRQDNPSDQAKVYKWMLSKIVDIHGNEIQYSYIKDSGQIYPNQILYTYHPAAGAAHIVNFTYTTPSSQGAVVYNPAFAVTTYKLLSSITESTTIDGQTSTISYSLNYEFAQNQKQSVLTSITRTASVPVFVGAPVGMNDITSFAYSAKTAGWEQGTHSIGENYPNLHDYMPQSTFIADFDANGYSDILVSTGLGGSSYTPFNKLLMNNGTNFTEASSSWNLPVNSVTQNTGPYFAIVDINGDHLPDLHPRKFNVGTNPSFYLNNGSSFVEDTTGKWEISTYVPETFSCGPNTGESISADTNTFLYDINSDGKNDLIHFGGTSDFKTFLNNGNGFTQSTAYTFTPAAGVTFTTNDTTCDSNYQQKNYQSMIDFNSDGLLDYYHQNYGAYINTGSGFAYNAAYNLGFEDIRRISMADINGDGLFDFVGYKKTNNNNGCIVTSINNGSGFSIVNSPGFPNTCSTNNNEPWYTGSGFNYISNDARTYGTLVDVTADGFPDVIGAATNNNIGKLRSINNGKNSWVYNPPSNDPWTPMIAPGWGVYLDVNSDNIIDYISSLNDGASGTCPVIVPNKKVCVGRPSIPNRLSQITNSFGGQTVVEYGTAPTNQSDTNIAPQGVVKKITVQNIGQNQPSMVTQYSYVDGVYVVDQTTSQKRFAGFHKVTSIESGIDLVPLRTTESYFHQANGQDSATNEPIDNNLSIIGRPYYTLTSGPSALPKKETWNKYGSHTLATQPAIDRLSNFVYPTETVTKVTDSSGATGTAEVYVFDSSIGERTELRNMGLVTVANTGSYTDISGDSKYEFTEYANNPGNTIVKPKREDIRTSQNSSDTIARTDYFYDSQPHGAIGSFGDLTKETKWVSGNGVTTADTAYAYDVFGNIVSITNPRMALTTYAYDSSKSLVVTETNHLNQVTTNEYMGGYLKKVIDPNGRTITYDYSDKGWLYKTIVANSAGNQEKIQYMERAPSGVWAIARIDYPVGATPDYSWQVFDGLGRPTRLIRRLANHSTSSNNAWYLKEAKTYDELGRISKVSAPYGTPNSSDWHYLISTTVPASLITTTSYDVFDRPTSVVNALGTSSISYAGLQTTTVDASNHQKQTSTDAYGNLVQVKEYNGSGIYTTNYSYDARNLLIGITDAMGNVRGFTYNNAGWMTSSEDLHAAGDSTFGSYNWTYDLNGNKLVETQPNGVTVTRVYDMLDRPISVDGSSTAATDYTMSYDSCTNGKGQVCNIVGTLPNGVSMNKTFAYSISGQPTSVSMTTVGNTYTTGYQYNLSDEVKQINYPNGTIVKYAYGDWGKQSAIYLTLPGQNEMTYATTTYSAVELPLVATTVNGPTITYTYDSAKLYRKTGMTTVQNGNTLQSYGYTYDNVNNITQITEPGLTKTYTYDDLNRLTQAVYTPSTGSATTHNYAYDAIGNITSANGKNYTYSGIEKANPHAVTSIAGSGASTEMLSTPWNLIGNNGSDEEYQSVDQNILNGKESITVKYDLNGLCALGGDASAIIFDQNGWKYVSLSNYGQNCYDGVQEVTIPLSDFTGLNTSQNLTGMLHSRFWYGSNFDVDIISVKINSAEDGGESYSYDDNGNVVSAPDQTFTYNWQNQPTNIVVNGSTSISSAYDESGHRFLYQTPSSTEIQIDDNYIVRNSVPEISLNLAGMPVGTVSNGTAYAAIADHLGTPVKQVSSSGAVVENVSYNPFGEVIAKAGSLNTKKGYTGHEYDVDTGLNYMGARYYSPSIGRFVSQDPVFITAGFDLSDPQSMNSYAYARNNPIRFYDPDGMWFREFVSNQVAYWGGVAKAVINTVVPAAQFSVGMMTNPGPTLYNAAKSSLSYNKQVYSAGKSLVTSPQARQEAIQGTQIAVNQFVNSSPNTQADLIGQVVGYAGITFYVGQGPGNPNVVRNAGVVNRSGNVIYNGSVNLTKTISGIEDGTIGPRLNRNGSPKLYQNLENHRELDYSNGNQYYEYNVLDSGAPGNNAERILRGTVKNDIHYSGNHYKGLRTIKK